MNTSVPKLPVGLTLRANFSWTFAGNVINAVSWLSMTIVLARLGSPEDVGQFALGLAITAPIFMFATLRLRDVQATDTKQEYRFGDYFALRLTTTAMALLAVVGIVVAFGFQREMALVILATGASKGIEAISDVFYGLFMQHERLDRSAKSLIMKGPLSLIALGIGFYLTDSVFWGVVGLAAVRAVIMVVFDFRNVALSLDPSSKFIGNILPKKLPRPRWDAKTLHRLVRLTLPLGFVTMLISLNSTIPRYFIEGNLGAYQLGIFAAVAAFQKAAPTVVQALGRSATPRLARFYAAGNARSYRKLMLRLVGIALLLGGAGVLVALFGGRLILTMFYGEEYALPGLFGLVMLAAGIDYLATMFLFVMTSARYFRVQLPLQLLATGTVTLASFLLIPSIGLVGAAMALIMGSLVRAGGGFIAAWHAQRALYRRSTTSEFQTNHRIKSNMQMESFPIQQQITLTATPATLVESLIDRLTQEEIVYSHWKSNIDLAQATVGDLDLDLLVDRKSLPQALAVLSSLGFKAAVVRLGANPPSIRHFYGLDPDTKHLIHVHLFSRVLTGESFVKSHLLPFEAMLLENVYYSGQIRVASKSAELVLFTLRMFIKYGSLLDLARVWRKSESIRTEVRWLQEGGDLSEALSLANTYCPVVEAPLFVKCVETLNSDSSLVSRMILARKVRRRLKVYAKYSYFERLLAYGQVLWAEVRRRMGTKRKNKVLQGGGAVIAIVGADATGKSTLVTETGRWLGDVFALSIVHTGKPPSSWLTAPVNIALTLARKLTSLQSVSHPQSQTDAGAITPTLHEFRGLPSLLFALRSVTLAWDRQRLILRTRRRAAKGEIIVCDRYPSRSVGAMDSPRLEESPKTGLVAATYNYLARLEKTLYKQIPPPDIVLKLSVSLETAKRRNSARDGQDEEAYLEARHRQSQEWHMPGTRYLYSIDTEQTLEDTINNVKDVIWGSL